MNLIIFNKYNTASRSIRPGERTVRMNMKGGIITFSKLAIQDLKLAPNVNIVFAQDTNKQKSWFIAVDNNKDESSFVLKHDSSNTVTLRCTGLVRKIAEDFRQSKSFKFLIAKDTKEFEGMKFYQLIPYK